MSKLWPFWAAFLVPVSAVAQQEPLDKLTARPVVDDYHGRKIEDRFRFVEKMEPATVAWMRSQSAFTRITLDSIPSHAPLVARMTALGGAFGFIGSPERAGDRLFYRSRPPGADQSSLLVREPDGSTRTLVDVPALIAARGYPVALDGFEPSRDGRHVALRLSEKGSESSMLTVIDVATGRTIAGPVRMGPFTETSWDVDGKSLFFSRMPDPATTPETERYKNREILHWRFGSEPVVVVGARQRLGPSLSADDLPTIFTPRGTDRAILIVSNGVANEFAAWVALRADAAAGRPKWRQVATIGDAVTGIFADARGITYLTHRDAPGYKVTQAPWSGTAATARTVLPEQPGYFYETVRGGRDGLYVAGREKLTGAVWRIDPAGRVERLALPQVASIAGLEAESDRDGALVTLSGPATPDITYAYAKDTGFRDLRLEYRPRSFDPTRYRVEQTDAVAADGTKVPLLLLTRGGPRRPGPFLIEAYGAYGAVKTPLFQPLAIAGVEGGVGHAQCGVRGGGELGEAWRLAGKGANKPNAWRDAIACAQALIAGGYTTPGQLAIRGASMGGIVVGRAVIERPDLFAAAISAVGQSNPLRSETMPSGPANTNEIGSVATEQGFRDLLAMDSYQAILDGVKLPAFLVTAGMNDPRIAPWMPAKFAARLQEAGDTALLRIEEQAGHGQGSTRSARTLEWADTIAFVLWETGAAEWQPKVVR